MTKNVIKQLNESDYIVFYDLETTGLDKKNEKIIQFSAIRCQTDNLEELDRVNIYIKCPFSIPEHITSLNHIDDNLLERLGVEPEEAFKIINNFIRPEDILSGYNNQAFDDIFLGNFYRSFNRELRFCGNIDVLLYAKNIIDSDEVMVKNEKTGKSRASYKLANVTKYYDYDNQYRFHDAAGDIAATKFIFDKLLKLGTKMLLEDEAEEEKRISIPKQDAIISTVEYFSPSYNIQRVYINTDQGTLYYDHKKHIWKAQNGNINSFDADALREKAFLLAEATCENEFYEKMKKKKKVVVDISSGKAVVC